jgi:5'-phosphate synthase pdxT subunit
MPGGESTTIAHLLETSGIRPILQEKLDDGLQTFGTCAGLILLSQDILDGRSDQWSFSKLEVSVRRNGYGRQIASFESPVDVKGVGEVPGVFIRAPKIESVSKDVEVLATLDHGDGKHPVLVRQGNVWGCSFHPELTRDLRVHQLFTDSL